MFTGIIQTITKVNVLLYQHGDARLTIQLETTSAIMPGDSVAINGTCLTAVNIEANTVDFDVSAETLRCTNLGDLKSAQWVNIELAMLPTTRFGGHIVSGHVDGVAQINCLRASGESWEIDFVVPTSLQKYIASKGSVCIDGTSLTINAVEKNTFSVNIIPYTWQHTISQFYQIGTRVNLEVDVVARYLERLLNERQL